MRRRARPLGRRRGWWGRSGCALIVICLLSEMLAVVATPGEAAASGTGGALIFSPQSGPVGTQVTVTVTITTALPGSTAYLLSATPNDPAVRGCGDGVLLPEAPKFIVIPGQPTITTFTWPAEFFFGAYYLCAVPASDQKGPTIWSQQPFSVTSATPVPPSILAKVPSGGVAAGASFTLMVDTTALEGETPESLALVRPYQPGAMQLDWALASQVGTLYTFAITVPADTPPGTYAVRVLSGGGLAATSNPFQVVSDSAVSRGGPHTSVPLISVPGTSAISPMGTLLVAAIALLLALAVAGLVVPLLRGTRRGERPPRSPTS